MPGARGLDITRSEKTASSADVEQAAPSHNRARPGHIDFIIFASLPATGIKLKRHYRPIRKMGDIYPPNAGFMKEFIKYDVLPKARFNLLGYLFERIFDARHGAVLDAFARPSFARPSHQTL